MNKLVDQHMDTLDPEIDPDYLFKPLNPELEYVDATEFDMEMAHRLQALTERVQTLEQLVRQQALNMLSMAEHVRDLHAKVTAAPKSSIVLPDRFN